MFSADNVVHLKRKVRIILVKQAIFTQFAGAQNYAAAHSRAHRGTHADRGERRRVRAFAREITWSN